MQRKFVTNLFFLLFLNLLIKPFWILGIDRSVQNAVETDEYGIYYTLLNFSFLLNILLDFGITNFNNKNISQHRQLLTKHFSGITALKIMLGLLYMLIILVTGFFIGYQNQQIKFLLLLALNQFLVSFILYMRSNISGLHLFKTDSLLSILDRAIMIVICGGLLWGNITSRPFQIEWFVYAQTASYGFTALVAFLLVMKNIRQFKPRINFSFSTMILKQSFPFAMLILLMTFYNRIDTVMIERMLFDGAEQSGVYAQSYRLLSASNMIAYLFAGLLLPIFSRLIKQSRPVDELVQLSFRLLIFPAFILAVACFFYRHELMELMYHRHIEASSSLFGLLMICFIPVSSGYIFGTLLTANGNLKALNQMAMGGIVLNVILNLLLIPQYKAMGAAVATFSTQFLTAVFQIYIAQRQFNFKTNVPLFISMGIFCVLLVVFGWLSSMMDFNWLINLMVLLTGSIILAFVTKAINIHSIYKVIRYGTATD